MSDQQMVALMVPMVALGVWVSVSLWRHDRRAFVAVYAVIAAGLVVLNLARWWWV